LPEISENSFFADLILALTELPNFSGFTPEFLGSGSTSALTIPQFFLTLEAVAGLAAVGAVAGGVTGGVTGAVGAVAEVAGVVGDGSAVTAVAASVEIVGFGGVKTVVGF